VNVKKIFGPPGSGKTTHLLNIVQQELDRGISPVDIGYFAFTRKAANEAKERAVEKFPHLNGDRDFPWFRTLHSMAYRCLGINQKDMMSAEHYKEFADQAGISISVSFGDESFAAQVDHPVLNEINIARIRGEDLRSYYNRSKIEIEWFHFELIERSYRHYKQSRNLLDFTDLLEHLMLEPDRVPRLQTVIIDEAQDLSRLQWNIVNELVARSTTTYIAGDDDQAVYTWAGADVASFLSLPGDIQVLEQSYRVPAKVHALADKVVNRIRSRQPKTWKPREFDGAICAYNDYTQVDVTHGDWLILASTNYLLNDMNEWLKSQGLLYERHGHKSISENILSAVVGWENLRKGNKIPFPILKHVYQYLDTSYVKTGFKTLKHADPEKSYDIEELKQSQGLLNEAIWHEALTKIGDHQRDYIRAVLRRGTKITGRAPIRLSTIHGAKGGEADNVLLRMDLSTKFVKDSVFSSDDLNRLLYVGITRSRKTLHIVLPTDERKGFQL
jgi:DNA helicase-2/ATP-dependent DNA helicase PcrA